MTRKVVDRLAQAGIEVASTTQDIRVRGVMGADGSSES